MVKLKLVILIICIFYTGCSIIFDRAVLPPPENIQDKGIQLDGYYYTIDTSGGVELVYEIRNIIIPYSNGIYTGGVNCGLGISDSKLDKLLLSADLNILKNYVHLEDSRNWSNIRLKSDSIYLQRVGGRFGDCIHTYSGRIINDTTFNITYRKSTQCAGDTYEERQPDNLNLVFHFRKFGPKPDSSLFIRPVRDERMKP